MGNKAIVAKIDCTEEITGADKIQIAKVLGEQVIVSKEMKVGDIGVLFPADVQLSEEFCCNNNLFRDKEKNINKEVAGFFDDNRRVRVQPFMKVKSQAYFTTLESLKFATADFSNLSLGATFDTINGKSICCKYISKATKEAGAKNKAKQAKKDFAPLFAKHVDSEQFKHFANTIKPGSIIYFHAKVHGTSHRSGFTLVTKELSKWQKFVNNLFKREFYPTTEFQYVVGTRNTVLNDESKEGFHSSESFRFDVANSIKQYLKNGMTAYGEIAGYANGKPIMSKHSSKATKDKNFIKKYGDEITYKYGCKEHEYRFHVYRITQLSVNNEHVEMPQMELDKWCKDRNILGPVEIHPPIVYDGDVEKLRNLVEQLTERPEHSGEDYIDSSHPSEGIILRVEDGSSTPKFFKNKSYFFRVMEGIAEAIDTEDAA